MLIVPSFILPVEKNVNPHITRTPFGRLSIPPPLFLVLGIFIIMEYIIDESKLTNVILKYLNQTLDGFEDMDYNWADFNCGWGVCCDIYAIGFVLPDREHDDYLFKLVDGENYNDNGDYPEELMGSLPEPCYDLPNITESRFDTLWLGEELIDELVDMFGGMDVWGKSFLNLVNQKYGTTANNIG
jgi:hypothetical protein